MAALAVACGDDLTMSSDDGGTTEAGGTTDSPPNPTVATSSSTAPTSLSGTVTTAPPTTSTTDPPDGSTTVVEPFCGDGVLDPDEECDDGDQNSDDACNADCEIPFEVAWTVSYNGPTSNIDVPGDIRFDGAGNLLVVGRHRTATDGSDVWLQQYAPDGTELWNFTWDGGNQLNDGAEALALHDSGDVIIVGFTETALDDDDIMVMRLPFDGDTPTWIDVWDGSGSGPMDFDNGDYANAVEVDSNGDIVVVGNDRVDGEQANVWLRKYDPDGAEIWLQTYNGAADRSDTCSDVAIDSEDAVYALCIVREDAFEEAWLRKYDAAGAEVWTNGMPYLPAAITLDADGNIVITGTVDSGTDDIMVAKYDADFTLAWSVAINGPSAGADNGRELTTDADGNVYVTGTIARNGEQDNLYSRAFDPDGNDLWGHAYNNAEANLAESGRGIAVADDGAVFILGEETVLGEQRNIWIRRLDQL